jgi:hypothetical protein
MAYKTGIDSNSFFIHPHINETLIGYEYDILKISYILPQTSFVIVLLVNIFFNWHLPLCLRQKNYSLLLPFNIVDER